jgi:S-DNA-T family DNA segregation ATPase FtsK/SpoIIIE
MAKAAEDDGESAAPIARPGAATATPQRAFTIPPLSLLDAPKTERKIDERELMEGARLLEEKCREFSVEGAVAQIHPGRWSRHSSSSRTPG